MADSVRIGVIGLGNIGQQHVNLLQSGEIQGASLAAVCARSPNPDISVPHFTDYQTLLDAKAIDAVVIATPTMDHQAMGRAALNKGVHVLMEKPLTMSVASAQELLTANVSDRQFALMLNQRFHPAYARIKQILDAGTIGALQRFSWTMTAWYRPDVYYKVSAWRGTWPGEGGGLLINQCIHNLDVLQWLTGLPQQLFAVAGFGKYHNIEVEDEVTATLIYDSGLTGTITASSGEAPGINQFDLVGDKGMLRFDGENIELQTGDEPVSDHCAQTNDMFGMPAFSPTKVEPLAPCNQHAQVLQNFVHAISQGETLLTPAAEGINSLQLANAMIMSAWQQSLVSLPVDAQAYEQALQQKISQTSLRTVEKIDVNIDMEQSYR